jgi:multidrug resistance efflux pump
MTGIPVDVERPERMLAVEPPWFVEWGNTIILSLLVLLLGAASAVRYPDIVRAPVIVSGRLRMADVIATSAGRVTILVGEDAQVAAGTVLAVIDNPVHTEDVAALKVAAERAADPAFVLPPPRSGTLGELEAPYAALLSARAAWERAADAAYRAGKTAALRADVARRAEMVHIHDGQVRLLENEVAVKRSALRRADTLYAQKLLSDADLDQARGLVAEAEQRVANERAAGVNNRIELGTAEQSLADLTRQFDQEHARALLALEESRRGLLAAIAAWGQRYTLVAPAAGRVSFHAAWASGQIVRAGDAMFTILPVEAGLSARAFLPRDGVAKVHAGQSALLKLDDFPFEEHGALRGVVVTVSPMAHDDRYAVTLRLPEGFRTTNGRVVEARAELRGTAEITTDDRTLFSRIFDRLRAARTAVERGI